MAHALITAIARLDKDSNHDSFHKSRKIIPVVRDLLETTGIDLVSGAGILDVIRYAEHFREYKIEVYKVLS